MNYPDFGTYILIKNPQKDAKFVFMPFKTDNISIMKKGSYSTTTNIHFDNQCFALTIDFNETLLKQLLRIIPQNIFLNLKETIEKAEPPAIIEFPTMISIGVTAKLGKRVTAEDGVEFVPLNAVEFYSVK